MVNTRFEAPEGTSRVKFSDWPDEPDWPVTGTPLVRSPPPGPGSPGSSPSQLQPTLDNADATSPSLNPRSVAACSPTRAPWSTSVPAVPQSRFARDIAGHALSRFQPPI